MWWVKGKTKTRLDLCISFQHELGQTHPKLSQEDRAGQNCYTINLLLLRSKYFCHYFMQMTIFFFPLNHFYFHRIDISAHVCMYVKGCFLMLLSYK